jgi:NADH-quinone oxidoreductase subunit L
VGGFLALPHFLEPLLPLPEIPEHLHHLETPLLVGSIVVAFVGLAGAAYFFGNGAVRAARMRERFPALHRLLSGKYFIDELYEQLIGRPLVWISDRVFLRTGDRMLFDGTLHGLAGLARRTAGAFSRVQTGNLHLYAFLVIAGMAACLVWSFRHG